MRQILRPKEAFDPNKVLSILIQFLESKTQCTLGFSVKCMLCRELDRNSVSRKLIKISGLNVYLYVVR